MMKKSLSKNLEQVSGETSVSIRCLSVLEHTNNDRKVNAGRCSERPSYNHVAVTTGFEDGQNMVDELSCCLKKIGTAIVLNFRIVNLVFAIIDHGGNEMNKKIEISEETDEIVRRNGRMGDTYDDVIRRGFAYLDSCSEFWNGE